jgi:membrane protein implicated in regulation of membrane protease activity
MEGNDMLIVWAVACVVTLIAESQTAGLVAIWFFPGTLVSLILSICSVKIWIQLLVFVVLSALFLWLGFRFFRRMLLKDRGRSKTDTDLLIGQFARVEEDIDNVQMKGAVKIDGKVWSARMENDTETASVGELVTVVAISGVKLICKRK